MILWCLFLQIVSHGLTKYNKVNITRKIFIDIICQPPSKKFNNSFRFFIPNYFPSSINKDTWMLLSCIWKVCCWMVKLWYFISNDHKVWGILNYFATWSQVNALRKIVDTIFIFICAFGTFRSKSKPNISQKNFTNQQ